MRARARNLICILYFIFRQNTHTAKTENPEATQQPNNNKITATQIFIELNNTRFFMQLVFSRYSDQELGNTVLLGEKSVQIADARQRANMMGYGTGAHGHGHVTYAVMGENITIMIARHIAYPLRHFHCDCSSSLWVCVCEHAVCSLAGAPARLAVLGADCDALVPFFCCSLFVLLPRLFVQCSRAMQNPFR